MRIAVTGSCGRLGKILLPLLISQGHTVRSLDRIAPEQTLTGVAHTTVVMEDFPAVKAAFSGCDAIIHLAAWVSPHQASEPHVYVDNTVGSYHVLQAAAELGIQRLCLASSINAIGSVYSRAPRYDYFPVDEQHPTYAEDPYSLSKWVLEQQANAFVRRYETMRIASLRFHGLIPPAPDMSETAFAKAPETPKHLWGYTNIHAAAQACLLSVIDQASWKVGHEAFFIVAPQTLSAMNSRELARLYYPETPIRGDLSGHNGFFDCRKAERLLGWKHGR